MFKRFFGGETADLSDGAWPASKILAALKSRYGGVDKVGEDGPIKVYKVEDNGVNFVVALMQSAPGSGKVIEIGFLARFVGFPTNAQMIETINRNLHISVVALEGNDLFLMAGVSVNGPYDDAQFMLLLESWRRDLAVTLANLSGDQASYADAFPVAKMAAARNLATNTAPHADGDMSLDMLSSFLGVKPSKQMLVCDVCNGRGKRGLIARTCGECDGVGMV